MCHLWTQTRKVLLTSRITPALPVGNKVGTIVPHGANKWTRTAEISTREHDGSPRSFFLKVTYFSLHYSAAIAAVGGVTIANTAMP